MDIHRNGKNQSENRFQFPVVVHVVPGSALCFMQVLTLHTCNKLQLIVLSYKP